jgi:hypothetical protein
MAWDTVASATLNADNAGWANHTIRQVISSAGLTNIGNKNYRITFRAGAAEGLKLAGVYIGLTATSGDNYDFDTTPTQVVFGGASSVTIAAGNNVVSDSVKFNLLASRNFMIAMNIENDTSYDTVRVLNTLTNWQGYYKSAVQEASTINVSSYVTSLAAFAVEKIESIDVSGAVTAVYLSDFGFM